MGTTRLARIIKDHLLVLMALVAVAGMVFLRLAREPGALLVDGSRASVDRANRAGSRPIGNDLTFFFLPHHEAISRHWEAFGRPPLWDPRGFGGRPLVGNPQAGVFYPPVWLAWWSKAPAAQGWITVLHLVWGGLGVYVLSRFLGRSRLAAIVAGCVLEISPFLLAHVAEGHLPHVWSVSYYPWAFWAFARGRGGDARGSLILALVLSASFLAGHPQEWLLLMVALCAWACADFVSRRRALGLAPALRAMAPLVATMGLSLLITAVDLVPQLAVRPWLDRDRSAPGHEPPAHYFLRPLNALQLFDPTAMGGPSDYFGDDNYWETVCSIGLAPLVLLAIAVFRAPDRRQVRGWLMLIGFSVWFACGRALGFYSLLTLLVPGVGLVRAPGRALFLANLGASVLVGMGLDALVASAVRVRPVRGLVLAGLVALGAVMALEPLRAWRALDRIAHEPRVIAVAAVATVILAGAWSQARRGWLMGALAVGELAWAGFMLMPVASLERIVTPRGVAAALGDRAPFRAPPRVKARDAVYGDLEALIDGVEKTNVNDSFQLDAPSRLHEPLYEIASRPRPFARALPMYEPVAEFKAGIRQAVLDRMSVEALVSDRVEEGCPWPIIDRGEGLVIARNPTAMPRAYVVPAAVVIEGNPAVVLSAFRALDPRRSVVMEADPFAGLPAGPRQGFKPARWLPAASDRVVLEVETDAPGLLVVADTWMPGWTARVDGRPATIMRGNLCQRVVALSHPGRHRIEMAYLPPGLILGAATSAVSALVWVILWVATRSRRIAALASVSSGRAGGLHGRRRGGSGARGLERDREDAATARGA